MRLVTIFELATCTSSELKLLLREAFNAASQYDPDSIARHNALKAIQLIKAEMSARKLEP